MGIDLLDIRFRIEKRFGVTLEIGDMECFAANRHPFDITAAELHFLVGAKLQEAGRPVPRGCWNGIRLVLAEALCVSPHKIKPESWLVKDLGMT